MDYYNILGLDKNATESDIKKAYRKLAMKYHPDRNAGDKKAEEQFKKIGEAYATLSDNAKRQEYDFRNSSASNNFFRNSGANSHTNTNSHFNDAEDIHEFMRSVFGNRNPFNDFFEDQFVQRKAAKRSYKISIGFWEAVFGVEKSFEFLDETGSRRSININLPPAIEDGSVLELQISGQNGLYLHINVEPDKYFTRDNLDLHTTIELPMTKAVLGGTIKFPHWQNELEVDVPPGTQNGQILRLANAGIRKDMFIGDLYLKCKVVIPTKLTKKQKELLESYSKLEKDKETSSFFEHLKNTWNKFFK